MVSTNFAFSRIHVNPESLKGTMKNGPLTLEDETLTQSQNVRK